MENMNGESVASALKEMARLGVKAGWVSRGESLAGQGAGFWAAEMKMWDVVEALVEKKGGGCLFPTGARGPLGAAVSSAPLEVAKRLVEAASKEGEDWWRDDSQESTIGLLDTCMFRLDGLGLDMAEFLLSKGYPPSSAGDMLWDPVAGAAYSGRVDMLILLLSHGGKSSARNPDGVSALYLAAWKERQECLRVLLEAGEDPLMEELNGETALSICLEKGDPECMRLMIPRIKGRLKSESEGFRKKAFDSLISAARNNGGRYNGACWMLLSSKELSEKDKLKVLREQKETHVLLTTKVLAQALLEGELEAGEAAYEILDRFVRENMKKGAERFNRTLSLSLAEAAGEERMIEERERLLGLALRSENRGAAKALLEIGAKPSLRDVERAGVEIEGSNDPDWKFFDELVARSGESRENLESSFKNKGAAVERIVRLNEKGIFENDGQYGNERKQKRI